MTTRKTESSAPNRTVLADVSRGRKLGEPGGFVGRFGVTSAVDPDDGAPIVKPEDEVTIDARSIRIHDMQRETPDGPPDRRAQFQVVNDWDAEYADARPGDAPYGQDESFTSANRGTRFADGQGRVALPASLERIVDSEDGRFGRALTLVELPLEGPSSELGKPDAGSGAPAPPPPPPGVALLDAGSSNGTGGSVTRKQPGVAIQGLTISGAAARAAAEAAIAAGGTIQEIRDAAIAASQGRTPPPVKPKDLPATQGRTAPEEPPPPQAPNIPAAKKPGGYVASERGGVTRVGLLGTAFVPSAGEPMFLGKEGTPIGTLPLRRDVQVATSYDRRGAFLIIDDDVAGEPEPTGRLIKGWIAHDSSKAGQDTALPGETHKLRPVFRIDASQIPPPAEPPPPYVDPEKKEEKEEDEPQDGPTPGPTPGSPGAPPVPEQGPGEAGGQPRPPGPIPPTPQRFFNAVGEPLTGVTPTGRTATGGMAGTVTNPQAQGRNFDAPGVPCPNATGGRVLTGSQALRGGTTGAAPSEPVISTGHPAVVNTGEGRILIGPSQRTVVGTPYASPERPATAADLAQGANAEWAQDRFVDRDGIPIAARGLDPVADGRVPLNELDAAIPVSAFPANRQAIVRARRANAEKREQAAALRKAAQVSGVERRRAQNERDHRINMRDLDRRADDARARRDAAQGKRDSRQDAATQAALDKATAQRDAASKNKDKAGVDKANAEIQQIQRSAAGRTLQKDQAAVDRANAELARLGRAKSDEQDRAARQRARLDRSQRQLDAQRRAREQRERAKKDQKERRAERAKKPQGGMPVEVTEHPLDGVAADTTGWRGQKEQDARDRAAKAEQDDLTRQWTANDALTPSGRDALGLPPAPSVLGTIPGLDDAILRAGGFGSQNVLTVPAPVFGEPGGPATVADALRMLGAQMRAMQSVVNGAFAGPSYLSSNIAVQHENTPGNPPAPSRIGAKWTAGPGESLSVGRGTPALEIVSQLHAEPGGRVTGVAGGAVEIRREITGGGKVEDKRPLVLIEERTATGQASGGEALAVGVGDGFAVTHDGNTRQRLADGSYWEASHEDDNTHEHRKTTATGQLAGGTRTGQAGEITSVGETGLDQVVLDVTGVATWDTDGIAGPALDSTDGVIRTPDLEGATTVTAGNPGFGISDDAPVYIDAAGDVHDITAGGASVPCPPMFGGSGALGSITRTTGTNLEISGTANYVNITMEGTACIRATASCGLYLKLQGDLDASTATTGGKISATGRAAYPDLTLSTVSGGNGGSTGGAGCGAVVANPRGTEPWTIGNSMLSSGGGGGGGSGGSTATGSTTGAPGAGGNGKDSDMWSSSDGGVGGAAGAGATAGNNGTNGSHATAVTALTAAYRAGVLANGFAHMGFFERWVYGSASGGGGGGGSRGSHGSGTTGTDGASGAVAVQTGTGDGAGGAGADGTDGNNGGSGGGGSPGFGGGRLKIEVLGDITLATDFRIATNGGSGGAGGRGVGSTQAGGGSGGGGAGGGGGLLWVLYFGTGTNVDTTRCTASGGAAGAGGASTGGGSVFGGNGGNGSAGEAGLVLIEEVG